MALLVGIALALAGIVVVGLVVRYGVARHRTSNIEVTAPTSELDDDQPVVPRDPRVDVQSHDDDYEIVGTTASELRGDLNAKGPSDSQGHHDANTHWQVQWTFPRDRSDHACGTGPVHVAVTITYRMPEWDPPSNADPGLVEKWRLYEKHLMTHEKGHAAHGVSAAEEILQELSKVPTRPTCDELDQVANGRALAIIEKYKAEDVSYDKATRHGATQGATFP